MSPVSDPPVFSLIEKSLLEWNFPLSIMPMELGVTKGFHNPKVSKTQTVHNAYHFLRGFIVLCSNQVRVVGFVTPMNLFGPYISLLTQYTCRCIDQYKDYQGYVDSCSLYTCFCSYHICDQFCEN